MTRLFLSYSHEDSDFAERLANALRVSGTRVWIGTAEIRVGDSLIGMVAAAVDTCHYLGVVLSPHSVRSRWVTEEVHIALSRELASPGGSEPVILPILYEPCEIPAFLRDRAYADFRGNFELGLKQLLARLNPRRYSIVLHESHGSAEVDIKNIDHSFVRHNQAHYFRHHRWAMRDHIHPLYESILMAAERPLCLVVGDGSELSIVIRTLAEAAGFDATGYTSSATTLPDAAVDLVTMNRHAIVVLIRGDHYEAVQTTTFYKDLATYVEGGGTVVAFPWVAWENQIHQSFARCLPVRYVSLREDVEVCGTSSEAGRAFGLGEIEIAFTGAMEELDVVDGSDVLATTSDDQPLLSIRQTGSGQCVYVNMSDHSCRQAAGLSPSQSTEIVSLLSALFQILRRSCTALE